jgi:hypothetical protein
LKYWIDTEFLEDGRIIDLLSLGIVAEDGRDHYFQSTECDLSGANEWVQANVLPHLEHVGCGRDGPENFGRCNGPDVPSCPWRTRRMIAVELIRFCDPERYGKPEFWGYYADYDWVAICQLFGRMIDLPKGWPMYCRDLKQWADDLGNPQLPEQGKDEHHALSDAQWNRRAWIFLSQNYAAQRERSALIHSGGL